MTTSQDRYNARLTTLSGYTIEVIQELQLTEIDLAYLSEYMGVSKGTLQTTIWQMRRRGLLTGVPTVNPRIVK
jgi:Mn-dependent DtxR family transcriptional regulator